eukprot:scaffold40798_cov63-Phaeocystis_antarctica.AAC.4
MLYTTCKACALDRQPCTASDSAMLWVDLSKCFVTFSRAVGQLLQTSRGVPAQVRKAVWSLYSRPHGSFDPLTGLSAAAPTLGAYEARCRRSYPHPGLAFQLLSCLRSNIPVFYISVQRAPKRHHEPAVQPSGWLPTWHDCHASEGAITCQGCGR